MALSDTRIRAAKAKVGRRYEIADDGGLHIEVQPSGAKVWRYRYRLHGVRQKVTIGPYPAIPIADQVKGGKVVTKGARTYHAEYQAMVAAGQSPARAKQAVRARAGEDDATFAGFTRRYIADCLSQHKRGRQSETRINRHLMPTLGNRQMEEITAIDLLSIIDKIKAQGKVQEARHVHILAKAMFRYAVERQRIQHNPAMNIRTRTIGPASSRDRTLTPDEIVKLFAALDAAHFLNPVHKIALTLVLLTLCRKGELVAAKWEHVDFEKGEWSVPASGQKVGIPHMVPLSAQAVELFKQLRTLAGASAYVLPSLIGKRDKPMSDSTLNWAEYQLFKARDGKPALLTIEHFTPHDFRRTASTILHGRNYASDWVEKSLGHKAKGVMGVYNKAAYLDQRREMLQHWADYLDALRQHGGKVVVAPFRKSA